MWDCCYCFVELSSLHVFVLKLYVELKASPNSHSMYDYMKLSRQWRHISVTERFTKKKCKGVTHSIKVCGHMISRKLVAMTRSSIAFFYVLP